VGQPRIAEVHLGVDHAGQQVQAAAIDHLPGGGLREVAEGGDAAIGDAEIAHAFAVLIDDGAALENEVEASGHSNMPPL
jgi:hypothetical protein